MLSGRSYIMLLIYFQTADIDSCFVCLCGMSNCTSSKFPMHFIDFKVLYDAVYTLYVQWSSN